MQTQLAVFQSLAPLDAPEPPTTDGPPRVDEALAFVAHAASFYDWARAGAPDPAAPNNQFATAGQALETLRAYLGYIERKAARLERAVTEAQL